MGTYEDCKKGCGDAVKIKDAANKEWWGCAGADACTGKNCKCQVVVRKTTAKPGDDVTIFDDEAHFEPYVKGMANPASCYSVQKWTQDSGPNQIFSDRPREGVSFKVICVCMKFR
jgi:ssDNA-binding Zn-finger/Zn-ribbon topoisomerase 1